MSEKSSTRRSLASVAIASLLVVLGSACAGQPPPPDGGAGLTCTGDDECSPGPCRTSTCASGRCAPNAALDGTPTSLQVAGDCKKTVCNADGTTRTVADDADAPMPMACVTSTCAGGMKSDAAHDAGAACSGGLCDGEGACVQGAGTACAQAQDCPSGHCVDGVCCNDACDGKCRSCAVTGLSGICANVSYYQADDWYLPGDGGAGLTCDLPISGARCDGAGECLKIVGMACNRNGECISGVCSSLKCLGATGEACFSSGECASGSCMVGACT